MPSEREKMLSGVEYDAGDPDLVAGRERAHRLGIELAAEADPGRRTELLRTLLGAVGEGTTIRPPLTVDYGANITIGARSFVNAGGVFLDCAEVRIGDHVQIGPNVQLLTPDHPRDPDRRRTGVESARPISVGDNVWLGGGVIVCPGVTIGADSIIGAGSVVTHDVPSRVVAAGNPCRVLRSLP